ncbi:MAG: hypothetical protein KDD34_00965 [Bdellovibrionales bacterium]|nr:hypothetical protein [Bdellovibrionales bacterium]
MRRYFISLLILMSCSVEAIAQDVSNPFLVPSTGQETLVQKVVQAGKGSNDPSGAGGFTVQNQKAGKYLEIQKFVDRQFGGPSNDKIEFNTNGNSTDALLPDSILKKQIMKENFLKGYSPKGTEYDGDWSTKGNGTGILCFPSENEAKLADPYLKEGNLIPNKILDKGQLRMLESWELEQLDGLKVWEDGQSKNWQEYYASVTKVYKKFFPLFMQKIEYAADWAKFSEWMDTNVTALPLEKVEEVNPSTSVPNSCRLVPIVTRYQKSVDGKKQISEKEFVIPQTDIIVKVVFYPSYFNRLSISDQAILVFHEQIYVLAKAFGHKSSDEIRFLLRYFFSNDVKILLENSSPIFLNKELFSFKEYLVKLLGDYVQYFALSAPPKVEKGKLAQKHYSTFYFLNTKYRDLVGQCREAGKDSNLCRDEILSPEKITPSLNEEESFLYWTRYLLENSMKVFNSDLVMNPEASKQEFNAAMSVACIMLEDAQYLLREPNLMEKALQYCDAMVEPNK